MFEKFKLRRKFRKEVDKDILYKEAVASTKAYFKRRGIPHWTSEYQNTFAIYTMRYCNVYLHAHVKKRLAEHYKAQKPTITESN